MATQANPAHIPTQTQATLLHAAGVYAQRHCKVPQAGLVGTVTTATHREEYETCCNAYRVACLAGLLAPVCHTQAQTAAAVHVLAMVLVHPYIAQAQVRVMQVPRALQQPYPQLLQHVWQVVHGCSFDDVYNAAQLVVPYVAAA